MRSLLLLALPALAAAAVFTTTVFLNPLEDLNTATTVNGVATPHANTSGALGYATVAVDSVANTVAVSGFTSSGLSGNIAFSHFHVGVIGANGGILFAINHTNTSVSAGTYNLTADYVTAFLNGSVYMNVHTSMFPSGEFRGQVGFANVGFAVLTNSQDSTNSTAYGFGSVYVNDTTGNVTVTSLNLVGLVNGTLSHIHGTGFPGATASPVCPIVASGTPGAVPAVQATYMCPTSFTAPQIASLRAGGFYFNVHTPTFPLGAIRGQIYFPSLAGVPTISPVTTGGASMMMMMGGMMMSDLGYSMVAPYNNNATTAVAWYAVTGLPNTETNASFTFASGASAPVSSIGQGSFQPITPAAGQNVSAATLSVATLPAPPSPPYSPPPPGMMSPTNATSAAAPAKSAAAAAALLVAVVASML